MSVEQDTLDELEKTLTGRMDAQDVKIAKLQKSEDILDAMLMISSKVHTKEEMIEKYGDEIVASAVVFLDAFVAEKA